MQASLPAKILIMAVKRSPNLKTTPRMKKTKSSGAVFIHICRTMMLIMNHSFILAKGKAWCSPPTPPHPLCFLADFSLTGFNVRLSRLPWSSGSWPSFSSTKGNSNISRFTMCVKTGCLGPPSRRYSRPTSCIISMLHKTSQTLSHKDSKVFAVMDLHLPMEYDN